ncbi:hypothetical protein GCM10028798_34000 [Humibacter antri]
MPDRTKRSIELDQDMMLVLFEMLHRWEDERHVSSPIDEAERAVLSYLSAATEAQTDEAFSSDYDRLVDAAKNRIVLRPEDE